jgi:serine/threonine-protein kinase RsbW
MTEHTRRFRARLDELSRIETFVESSIAGMPSRVVTHLRLVVEELFVNTVTYGHGGDSEAPVDVTVRVDGDHVTLVYEDSARAFDPFARVEPPDPAASIETRDVGRLGVFLVTRLAERYDYTRTDDRNRGTVALPAEARR